MRPYIIAHDTGTGGNKAVLTDLRGRIIHSVYRPYRLHYPRHGWVEQDPDVLWHAVASTTRLLIEQKGIDPVDILGVGISAQMFNLLPVDERVRPLMPMISWLDLRTVAQADRVMAAEDGRLASRLFEYTGNIPTAKDIIPKILWLKEERPAVWEQTRWLLDCKEYIVHRLTGKIVTDWHGASVFFLFDPERRTWSERACRALGIPRDRLPPAHRCTDTVGEVSEEAAVVTGLQPGTPVVACAGDVAVAQSGSGSNAHGKAHLCVGTATWLGVSSNRFVNDPAKPFWGLSHIDPDKWIIAGEMETGGGALMWFRDAFCQAEAEKAAVQGISTYQLLSRMAMETRPGADGLLFAPWLSGERAPILDHYARGAFVGLSLGHTKAHLARAVMEGVAFHLRWICEALEQLGLIIGTINAIGGGCTSPVWTQIIGDVLGRDLRISSHPQEAGAIGAALTVAVGMGVYPGLEATDELVEFGHTVEPQTAHSARYDALYSEYRALYEALAPVMRRMHTIPREGLT
jgi:xylulokinase